LSAPPDLLAAIGGVVLLLRGREGKGEGKGERGGDKREGICGNKPGLCGNGTELHHTNNTAL